MATPVQFVRAFDASDDAADDGVATPKGFQDTPDQWYHAGHRKRGLSNVATQRDSEATQPQSVATQPQSIATAPDSAAPPSDVAAPTFVYAMGSLGDNAAPQVEEVDEDETQIMMTLSQDREALRLAARRIKEEELQLSLAHQEKSSKRLESIEEEPPVHASDAESDLSDDMLGQDGDINGLSSIAATFQQQEAEDKASWMKKAPVYVSKPRGLFQISPPPSVEGGIGDDSSGAETEVDEEPAPARTDGESAAMRTPEKAARASTPVSSSRKRRLTMTSSTSPPPAAEQAAEQADVEPIKSAARHQELRVMFTGLDGTIPKLRDKVKRIANAVQEDDDVEKVTHLVAPRNQLKRTVKLLCGISCCDHIVDERWLDESARAGVAASEIVHCLKDTAAESKWDFSLFRTMYEVPKDKRRTLFAGLQFFITSHKSVLPPVKELVRIVECAGGSAETKGAATAEHVVITTDTAMALASVRKAVAHADPQRIFTPEFVLSSILRQRLDLASNRVGGASEDNATTSMRAKKRTRR
ncbi:hypothetical protein P43SY_010093 [Pythium insidiosum]|uniref:BRCT domain-containing protein n=1 Tax=Pythium insidiosum TaxID=114742 RepID=A0AAD5LMB9_PYTIN|nr:hypothetical protein P43SY_010093 [Pythium insidiosum]